MGRIIKLNERDLQKIVKRVLQEQTIKQRYGIDPATAPSDYLGKGGQFERGLEKNRKPLGFYDFKCIPRGVNIFANYVVNNQQKLMSDLGVDKTTLLLMAKAAIGIMGRETTFGTGTEFKDDAAEFLMHWGLGFIPKTIQTGYNKVRELGGKSPQQMSLGTAQFTEDTWNTYGLDKKVGPYKDSFNAVRQGIGALHRINDDFKKALKLGTGTGPSVNPIAVRQGKIKSINGTGNNALDLAIVTHNMPGLINRWCQTSDPNFAGPCDKTEYQPYPESKPEIKLKVFQNKQIPNYFPNKGSGKLTSIGYLEEVAGYMNKFNCFNL
jgi:hypothetical protein